MGGKGWLRSALLLILLPAALAAGPSNPSAQVWASRYNGPANGNDVANAMSVSPDGARVFVTGSSAGPTGSSDYATVAYDVATGAPLWRARYNGPGNNADIAKAIAVSPGGSAVFVTGVA